MKADTHVHHFIQRNRKGEVDWALRNHKDLCSIRHCHYVNVYCLDFIRSFTQSFSSLQDRIGKTHRHICLPSGVLVPIFLFLNQPSVRFLLSYPVLFSQRHFAGSTTIKCCFMVAMSNWLVCMSLLAVGTGGIVVGEQAMIEQFGLPWRSAMVLFNPSLLLLESPGFPPVIHR